MKKKQKNTAASRRRLIQKATFPKLTDNDFDRWLGRLAAIVVEGRQQLGAGLVMQTSDSLTYMSTEEFAIIGPELAPALAGLLASCTPNQFVIMVAGDNAGAMGIIDAPAPLAELHRQWAKTLEATR